MRTWIRVGFRFGLGLGLGLGFGLRVGLRAPHKPHKLVAHTRQLWYEAAHAHTHTRACT